MVCASVVPLHHFAFLAMMAARCPTAARVSAQPRRTVGVPPRRVFAKAEKAEKAPWTEPTLDPNTPAPIFGGSTGGLLSKASEEEFYVITWEAKKEQIFEMPTGGAAIMRSGPNMMKLARKEQCVPPPALAPRRGSIQSAHPTHRVPHPRCLALTTQLRNKFKTDACFYRVFPNGEVQYLHPLDGVYPEKVRPPPSAPPPSPPPPPVRIRPGALRNARHGV